MNHVKIVCSGCNWEVTIHTHEGFLRAKVFICKKALLDEWVMHLHSYLTKGEIRAAYQSIEKYVPQSF